MSLYGDKLTQSIGSGVDQVTYSVGSGKDNLTQSAGTAVDNFTKAAGTAVDNLAYPQTRTNGVGEILGDLQVPGGDVTVQSVDGFPAAGDAYVKIGTAIIKFSYTGITSQTFNDCHSYDTEDYAPATNQEVYLNQPRSL